MKSDAATAAIQQGEPPVWLLTLTFPSGQTIRVASAPVSVEAAGGPLQYHPMLSEVTEFEEELDLSSLDGVGTLTQARVDLATDVDLAELAGDWRHITAARVELSLIWEGQRWEERHRVLSAGAIAGIEWGLPGEATTVVFEAAPPRTSANAGDDTRDLGKDWEGVQDNGSTPADMTDLSGSKYQRVYGDPESIPAYKVGDVGGNNRLVLAGHPFPRTGGSYQVTVYEDGASIGGFSVDNGTAGSGPYAYVEDAAAFKASSGAYTYRAQHGGIAGADSATAPALQASGVLRKLLQESEVTVDWVAMSPALERLRSWRFGFYTDSQAPALDIIRERLLPYLPLVEMQSGGGLWYRYVDPAREPARVSLRLQQGLLGRVGRLSTTPTDEVVNRLTLRYWLDAFSGEYLETVSLSADNDALCALSRQLYGDKSGESIECDAVWDEATALRVIKHIASRQALPRRIVSYQLAPDLHWLRAGDVVTLTDEGYGLNGRRAMITRISRTMAPFTVTFEVLDRTPMSD